MFPVSSILDFFWSHHLLFWVITVCNILLSCLILKFHIFWERHKIWLPRLDVSKNDFFNYLLPSHKTSIFTKVLFTHRYTWQNFGLRLLRLVNNCTEVYIFTRLKSLKPKFRHVAQLPNLKVRLSQIEFMRSSINPK